MPLNIGTSIVLLSSSPPHPKGAIARVTRLDGDDVHLEFADATTAMHPRNALTPLQNYLERPPQPPTPLFDHIILSTIIGSHAYGLAHNASDVDRRGVFLPPASLHWGLQPIPDTLQHPTQDAAYWEIQRFLNLALQSKPQPLEVLFTPIVEHATPLAVELRNLRSAIVSRLAYHSYTGYALSAHRQILKSIKKHKGALPFKDLMHLIRLLMNALHLLKHATLPVDLDNDPHRDLLLAILNGERTLQQIDALRLLLLASIEDAFTTSPLPERPDAERVNAFLIRARKSAVSTDKG